LALLFLIDVPSIFSNLGLKIPGVSLSVACPGILNGGYSGGLGVTGGKGD